MILCRVRLWLALLLILPALACARATAPAGTALPVATRIAGDTYGLSALPGQLTLAGERLFFTAAAAPGAGSRRIYSLDLPSGRVHPLVESRYYPDGILDTYRLGLAGDWLVYLETPAGDNGRSWTLAAHNLASGETIVIDRAQDDRVGWPGPEVAADGDWIVWLRKEAQGEGVRSLIQAYNLADGERRLVGDPLDAGQESWGWPNLQGGQLVVERDRAHSSSVYLIDLASAALRELPMGGPASEPALAGRYVVCKGAGRYGRGKLLIYDLESEEVRSLDLNVEYPHAGDGLVVAWVEGRGLVRIDPATGEQATLAGLVAGAAFRPTPEATINGRRVAWLEWTSPPEGPPQARLRVQ